MHKPTFKVKLFDYFVNNAIQGSHRDWKTWKMKVVMEKSWNVKKSWNFVTSHGNLPILPPKYTKFICCLPPLFRKWPLICKIAKRDGHGNMTNGHGKVIENNFVKSVGTLAIIMSG